MRGFFEELNGVHFRGVDGDGPQLLSQLQAGVDHVHRVDAGRAEELGGHHRQQADRAGADHGHGVTGPDLSPLGAEIGGGEDVAHEDRLLVGHALGDDLQGVIGQRHHHPLGLAAAQVPEVLAVAEGALVDALREPAPPAEIAVAAGGEEGGHHPVASSEAAHLGPHLLDHAGELVADHCTGVDRSVAVVDVQVRAADRAQGHLEQDVRRCLEARLGDVLDLKVAHIPERHRPHD